jgi:hypothetical protein
MSTGSGVTASPKPMSHLNGNADASDGSSGANSAIFDFLTDRRGFERIHVEDHAVIVDWLRTNGMESFGDAFRAVAMRG